jgi:hypothetical protein
MGHVSTAALAVVAALIGAGGSLLGGLVGGWYVVRAAQQQWQRDREQARSDRSRQAAMALAEALGHIDLAVANWGAKGVQTEELHAAFNTFAQSSALQALVLTDEELLARLRHYVALAQLLLKLARQGDTSADSLVPAVRRGARVLADSLSAHFNDRALPAYMPPPLDDVTALTSWRPSPSQAS